MQRVVRRSVPRCLARLGFALIAPVALDAQMRDTTPRPTVVDPVVTTATRDARALRGVPASVSVVDSLSIARSRAIHLGEVLRNVPGVQAGTLYGTDDVKITIRGAGVRSGFGVRGVAVLLDGIPLTEPDGQGRLDIVDLGTASRVEVVRGPVSALYGGAAGGGAVNLVSRAGRDTPGWGSRVVAGDFGTRRGELSYGVAHDEVDFLGAMSATTLAGYRDASPGFTKRARAIIRWHPAAATQFTVDGAYSYLDQRIPGALLQSDWDARAESAEPNNLGNRFRRLEERWRVALRATQAVAGGALDAYVVGSGRDNTQSIFQYISQSQKRLQLGAQFGRAWRVGGWAPRLVIGLDADRARGPQTNFTNAGGQPATATLCVNDRLNGVFSTACVDQFADLGANGAYAQGELTRGALTLSAGVRYDAVRYDIRNNIRPLQAFNKEFTQLSPRFALSWRASPTLTAYIAVARGFEVPTAVELSTSPDTVRPFNDLLGPSSQMNYEVGARGLIGSRFAFDAAVYRAVVDGESISRTVSIPGVPVPRSVFENAGQVRRTGLELSGTLLLTSWLDARGAYTFSDFIFESYLTTVTGPAFTSIPLDAAGFRVPGVPRHRASVELRVRPTRTVGLTLWSELQSGVYVDNTNASSGVVYQRASAAAAPPAGIVIPFQALARYSLTSATVTWRIGDAEVFASIDNLFDARYASNQTLNASNGRFYYPGPPRALSTGVSLRFAD